MSSHHAAAATPADTPPALPLVVRMGFSGSRLLAAHARDDTPAARAWLATLRQALREQLEQLPQALGLSAQHFIVGQSQLAVGADTLFTECLQQLNWPQRLLLPQRREEFLQAQGSDGSPDFLPHERRYADQLFDSPHVIDQAVVGGPGNRSERFDETNLRILGESDLLVCLRIEQPAGRIGGVQQLLERARVRNVPVLELVLREDAQAGVRVRATWHRMDKFHAPAMPKELHTLEPLPRPKGSGLGMPAFDDYAQRLKAHTSRHADRLRIRFSRAALVIVGTHVAATAVATLALVMGHDLPTVLKVMAAFEILLLGLGLRRHEQLHHQHDTSDWALTRLCAEIGRSAQALTAIPGTVQPLLALPFPDKLAPVLRTLAVLHQARDRHATAPDFEGVRDRYRLWRLSSPRSGQLAYYAREQERASRWKSRADGSFAALSRLAIVAVTLKLGLKLVLPGHDPAECVNDLLLSVLGWAAVVLPVLAVAAISLAAAFDLDARAATFRDMHTYLVAQDRFLAQARSLRELAVLAAETEARLLGENITWYSRRVFTGVA